MVLSRLNPFRRPKSSTSNPASAFQILSDLHLELCQQYQHFHVPPRAPYLVLAGDIGRLVDYDGYLGFLKAQTAAFERVFLVLGNHEFYGLTFDDGIARARQLEQEPSLCGKLTLLHQTRWHDATSGITVLGCTLWSKISAESAGITAAIINDFKQIQDWSVDRHNARFASDLAWLRSELKAVTAAAPQTPDAGSSPSGTVLVVTHHAPCVKGTSRPQHSSNPWSSAFATDVLNGPEWRGARVTCWVFGHTHYTTELVRKGVKVVSNQRGYVFPGEKQSRRDKEKEKLRGKGKQEGMHEFDVARVVQL